MAQVTTTTRVVSNQRILAGTPVIEGTRVPADTVLAEVRLGRDRDDILRDYPSLPRDGVDAALAWERAGRPLQHPLDRPDPLNDPLLIDECFSPHLVAVAQARGHAATHVVHRGMQGAEDAALMPVIRAGGFVFVTSNARDFLRLFAAEGVHGGLIIIVPGGIVVTEQMRLFAQALDAIAATPDLINTVVEVFSDGTVRLREWPRPGA